MTDRQRHILVTLAWVAMAVYFGLVAYVCFGHFDDLPDMDHTFLGIPEDKIIHFIMFFPFPILVLLTRRYRPATRGRAFAIALLTFVAGLLIASATEWGQGLTAYRDPDAYDLLADALAILFSTLIVLAMTLRGIRRSAR